MEVNPIRVKFVVVNVNTAAKLFALYEIETLVIGLLHKKTRNSTSNRIVIVKRKYIYEVETPPHHAI